MIQFCTFANVKSVFKHHRDSTSDKHPFRKPEFSNEFSNSNSREEQNIIERRISDTKKLLGEELKFEKEAANIRKRKSGICSVSTSGSISRNQSRSASLYESSLRPNPDLYNPIAPSIITSNQYEDDTQEEMKLSELLGNLPNNELETIIHQLIQRNPNSRSVIQKALQF